MRIIDYIERASLSNEQTKTMGKWWSTDVDWQWLNVNFYALLCFVPLWKFNNLYDAWYDATKGGAMGDFLEDKPTDRQIDEFLERGTISFQSAR